MLTVDGTSLQFEPAVCLRALRLHLCWLCICACAGVDSLAVPVLICHDKYRSSDWDSPTCLLIYFIFG
eukprot:COSAG01_NODE_37419_length_503_cov_84.061881_1_plen_67_part_10